MNPNYYHINPNVSFDYYQNTLNTQNNSTTLKENKNHWTPVKKVGQSGSEIDMNNDSTMIMSQLKYIPRMSEGTPEKVKRSEYKPYEASIRTPIKKSKRRECTPMYSDEENEGHKENYRKKSVYDVETQEREKESNLIMNMTTKLNSINSGIVNNRNNNFTSNYNLLRVNSNNTNITLSQTQNQNQNQRTLNDNWNKLNLPIFEKLSKSKFLEKIEKTENSNNNNNSLCNDQSKDLYESSEIIDKIKGAYLLCSIECEIYNPDFAKTVFTSLLENSELFNTITNLVCYSIFEGFNNRSDMFFKLLSASIFLEIVDRPLDSFNNNVALLTNYVLRLTPNYTNYQLDVLHDEQKYIFSIQGTSVLNTPNQDVMNFIMSIRIHFSVGGESMIRSDQVKIENIISVDYIKLKIFGN